MNARNFFNLVAELRRVQREYFKTRSQDALQQSKQLEKRVDDEITKVQAILAKRSCHNCKHSDGIYVCYLRDDYIQPDFAQTCQSYKQKQQTQ